MVSDSASPHPPRPRVGTDQHFRWLRGVLAWVLILNLLDAVLTILWVHAGLAREANPLMDELVTGNALLFVVVKLSLVGMGGWVLWQRRRSPFAVVSIFVAFVVYYGIAVHHLQYASVVIAILLGF